MMGLQDPAVSRYQQSQVIEKTGYAARIAADLLERITARLVPGMRESDARQMALALMREHGIEKNWHLPYIRFGTHSILTFLDKPAQDRVLGEDDIAYVDLGPVIVHDGVEIEGDVGKTVVFGDNPLFQELKYQSERIFESGLAYWRTHQPTGVELYDYIHQVTRDAGFDFHLAPAGHLIGSFPHQGWKKGLNTYPYPAEAGLWILEIQLRHPEKPYGAFYEAVLL